MNVSTVYIQSNVQRYEAGANATVHFMPPHETKGWRKVKALRSILMFTRPEYLLCKALEDKVSFLWQCVWNANDFDRKYSHARNNSQCEYVGKHWIIKKVQKMNLLLLQY